MTKNDTAKTLAELSPQGEWYGYASYIPKRSGWQTSGEFKRHKTLGHAKAAVAGAVGYGYSDDHTMTAVYEWVGTVEDGYWVGVDA